MSVEVPDPFWVRVTLAGLVDAVRPEGDTLVEREMLPAKPPRLFRLMVEVVDWPAKIVMLDEMEETEKSTTLTVTWTECVREPLVAVTVTV